MIIDRMAVALVSSLVLLMLGKLGSGVEIENKRYTCASHYRCAEDMAVVEHMRVLLLRRLTPAPRLITGNVSVNALPLGSIGKGAAALARMVHLRCRGLFFVGNDETDEDVFGFGGGRFMMGYRSNTGMNRGLAGT